MKQTHATLLVQDGVIMADQDQCIAIHRARIIIEPLDQPSRQDAAQVEGRVNAGFERMDRVATRLMKYFVVVVALYLLGEVVNAFSSGAFSRVVR